MSDVEMLREQVRVLVEGLRNFIGQSTTNEQRMRAAIVEARTRLAKGRALWNGPCHECDAILAQALTVNNDPADIARHALSVAGAEKGRP